METALWTSFWAGDSGIGAAPEPAQQAPRPEVRRAAVAAAVCPSAGGAADTERARGEGAALGDDLHLGEDA